VIDVGDDAKVSYVRAIQELSVRGSPPSSVDLALLGKDIKKGLGQFAHDDRSSGASSTYVRSQLTVNPIRAILPRISYCAAISGRLWHNQTDTHGYPACIVCRKKGWDGLDNDQNWYRQLAALVLLSASRAAVDYINNPISREDAQKQLREQFANIDFDAAAKAVTRTIDGLASNSKGRLNETIDVIRDRSVDAVDEAKSKAEKQLAPKKGGRKMRFLFAAVLGGIIAYFILDEQRRDDLLDRLTGASGPIQQSAYTPSPTPYTPPPSPTPAPSSTSETPASASSSGDSGGTDSTTA
jgi:hypothetical protein